MKRAILLCGALFAFLTLTAAGTGFTARQILTAAPSSGAVNLASATGTEGTSTALLRADAVLGVTGILPVANGGTGTSSLSVVNLQASAPGSAQTGHLNITGTAQADIFKFKTGGGTLQGTTTAIGFIAPGNSGSPAYTLDTSQALTGSATYISYAAAGSTFASMDKNGRMKVGNGTNGGLGTVGGSTVNIATSGGGQPVVTLDTGGIGIGSGDLLLVNNNTAKKWSVDFNGSAGVCNGTAALTPGANTGSQCNNSANQTCTGAALGDHCAADPDTSLGTTAIMVGCVVTAANTIQVRFCSVGTGTVTPPSANYKFTVFR